MNPTIVSANGQAETRRCCSPARAVVLLLGSLMLAPMAAQACEEDGYHHVYGMWANMRPVRPLSPAEPVAAAARTPASAAARTPRQMVDLRSALLRRPGTAADTPESASPDPARSGDKAAVPIAGDRPAVSSSDASATRPADPDPVPRR